MTTRRGIRILCTFFLLSASCADDTSGEDVADGAEADVWDVPDGDGGEEGGEAAVCTAAAECDDGLYCNGPERCDPDDAGADVFGCVAGEPPCPAEPGCDEDGDRCLTDCLVDDDQDDDTHAAAECGGDDCDDSDPEVHPGAEEVCDDAGRDEDCDPDTVGARDLDGDGADSSSCCNGTECGPDCNDSLAAVGAGTGEICDGLDNDCDDSVDEGVTVSGFVDADRDLHGDPSAPIRYCGGVPGASPLDDDCDDADPTVHGAQVEICDGKDNDCDGDTDEYAVSAVWYRDDDGDGWGTTAGIVVSCTPPAGYALFPGDCDDTDPDVSPGAPEWCDGRDTNCDGRADFRIGEGDYEDDDRDGRADAACGGDDCDDLDRATYAGAREICDARDNDCDTSVDEGAAPVDWYVDADDDGWGDDGTASLSACEPQPGRVLRGGDCNDADPAARPGMPDDCATQIGVDDDCDTTTDEGAEGRAWYIDRDGDGWGAGEAVFACEAPPESVEMPGDCDDLVVERRPTADESCAAPNDVDDDCDGETDCDDSDCWSFANCEPTHALRLVSGGGQTAVITQQATAPVVVEVTGILSGAVVGAGWGPLTVVPDEGVGPVPFTGWADDAGRFSFTYRMPRRPGPVTIRVRAPGARSIRLTGTATAPAAGVIVPVINAVYAGGLTFISYPATLLNAPNIFHVEPGPDGELYVVCAIHSAVFAVSPAGQSIGFAGVGGPGYFGDFGPANAAALNSVADAALDRTRGVMYLADQSNLVLRDVEMASGVIRTYAGGGTASPPDHGDGGAAAAAYLGYVNAVEVGADGSVYVVSPEVQRIRRVAYGTRTIETVFTPGGACSGSLVVCSIDNFLAESSGSFLVLGTACGSAVGSTTGACGDPTNAFAIVRVGAGGTLTLIAGDRTGTRTGTPLGTDLLLLSNVRDAAYAPDGDLWFTETTQHVVWRLDATTGRASIAAGINGAAGATGDYGRATLARLNLPWGIGIDHDGHVFIGDTLNSALRMIW